MRQALPYRFHSLIQTNATFRDIVISLVATYGLYLISSLMHFEPWHMFTSFIQYLFLQPSCKFHFRSTSMTLLLMKYSIQTSTS